MRIIQISYIANLGNLETEVIERKGIGHPDTMADILAERLSVAYSKFTLENYGAILHHNFDKLAILGGKTEVSFGEGRLISPIRVLLNGRATTSFAGKDIPVKEILETETKKFLTALLRNFDTDKDIIFHYNISNASGPGKMRESKGSRAFLFNPRSIKEVKGYDRLVNNDTSIGCAYAPLSTLEGSVLRLEKLLYLAGTKRYHWLGTDIKIMAIKNKEKYNFTICIPQISKHVKSLNAYKNNLNTARLFINKKLKQFLPNKNINISLNTRDDYSKGDIYLTVTGSSIESGDEGIVGRGNRINGLITPLRPMSLEGIAGKNPKYYTGKLYNIAASKIASRLHKETGNYVEVCLISQSGKLIIKPWATIVRIGGEQEEKIDVLKKIVREELAEIPNITGEIIKQKIKPIK